MNLAPGQSTRVSFAITPQDTSWWSDTANGWTQTAGLYHVYVGDSSALANLPLRNAFHMTSTPGARQVVISRAHHDARRQGVTVQGDADRRRRPDPARRRLALQLQEGWTVTPMSEVFGTVGPRKAIVATFRVTAPSYSPNVTQVVHATATMGGIQREAGVSVLVNP